MLREAEIFPENNRHGGVSFRRAAAVWSRPSSFQELVVLEYGAAAGGEDAG